MNPSRILVIHNRHAVHGGEDVVVDQEVRLLRAHGHTVELLEASNEEFQLDSLTAKMAAGLGTIWSQPAYRRVMDVVDQFHPNLAHVHNTFNRFSPSIYWALSRRGVPAVATLHNFLPLCANSGFIREGRVCLDCLYRSPLEGLRHRCYRDSTSATAAIVGMQLTHRSLLKTFPEKLQAVIVPSQRGLEFYSQAGWPASRLFYKPHFVEDPLTAAPRTGEKRTKEVLFVGRLSQEKGVRELLQAWPRTHPDWTLRIIGDGPLAPQVLAATSARVIIHPWCAHEEVLQHMSRARYVIAPSLWHEPFGMVAVEALACGTPVIATNRGGLSDIVEHQRTGLLFEPADDASLATTLDYALSQPLDLWNEWSTQARHRYLTHYHPSQAYTSLMHVYHQAMRAST